MDSSKNITDTMPQGSLFWITGLAGAGKSSLGLSVYHLLKSEFQNLVFLDGDHFREILGNDLGHQPADRRQNALRIARMCHFLTNQHINVICATISLFKEAHNFNRRQIPGYYEILLKVEMTELERRDQKGLYSAALKGEIKNVIGIDLPFDLPAEPSLLLENNHRDDFKKNSALLYDFIRGKLVNKQGNL